MPGVPFVPLGPQTQPPMRAHNIICIHTMVGSLAGTRRMFQENGYGGTESHYGTGGLEGQWEQWQDTAWSADANLDGNPEVISIENADHNEPGAPSDRRPFPVWDTRYPDACPPFTPWQIEANARIIAWESSREAHRHCPPTWLCHREGIPIVLIPDTRPGRRGVGFHAQGVEGRGLVAGGVKWSTARGKACPTKARIAQIPLIIDRAREIAGLQEDDDMSWYEKLPSPLGGWQELAKDWLIMTNKEAVEAKQAAMQNGAMLRTLLATQAKELTPEQVQQILHAEMEAGFTRLIERLDDELAPVLADVLGDRIDSELAEQVVTEFIERVRFTAAATEPASIDVAPATS